MGPKHRQRSGTQTGQTQEHNWPGCRISRYRNRQPTRPQRATGPSQLKLCRFPSMCQSHWAVSVHARKAFVWIAKAAKSPSHRTSGPAAVDSLKVLQTLRPQPPNEQGQLAGQKDRRRNVTSGREGPRTDQTTRRTRVRLDRNEFGPPNRPAQSRRRGASRKDRLPNASRVLPRLPFAAGSARDRAISRGLSSLRLVWERVSPRSRMRFVRFGRQTPAPAFIERTRACKLCHRCRFVPSKHTSRNSRIRMIGRIVSRLPLFCLICNGPDELFNAAGKRLADPINRHPKSLKLVDCHFGICVVYANLA